MQRLTSRLGVLPRDLLCRYVLRSCHGDGVLPHVTGDKFPRVLRKRCHHCAPVVVLCHLCVVMPAVTAAFASIVLTQIQK